MRLPQPFPRIPALVAGDRRPLAGVAVPMRGVDFLPFPALRALARSRRALRRLLSAWHAGLRTWRVRRRMAAACRELRSLDARTLRDLGLHDSELQSVVAEIQGDADPTRTRTFQALRGLD